MIDFLGEQALPIVARRQGPVADLLPEHRPPPATNHSSSAAAPAQPADQILLGGSVPPPPASLPLKPNEATGAQSRVSDVLRRPPSTRRKPAIPAEREHWERPEDPSVGSTIDLWA